MNDPDDISALARAFATWLEEQFAVLVARHPAQARQLRAYGAHARALYVRRTRPAVPPADPAMPLAPYTLLEELSRLGCEAGDFSKFAYYYGSPETDDDLMDAAGSMIVFGIRRFSTPVARVGLPTPEIEWTERHWIRQRRPDYALRFPVDSEEPEEERDDEEPEDEP